MKSNYLFESERLGFRTWKEKDKECLFRLNDSVQVMEFFPRTLTRAESDAFYDRMNDRMRDLGFCWFATELKETQQWIGFIGLARASFEAHFTPCNEIGWRLLPEFWGKGLATEGAKACLDYGRSVLGMEEIYSFTAKINLPSERVMQKIGMTKIGEFIHPKIDADHRLNPHVLYKL